MSKEEIKNELKTILFDVLEEEVEVHDDTSLIADLKLSSISLLYMAMDIESKFKIQLKTNEIAGISTVSEWVSYIEQKLNA